MKNVLKSVLGVSLFALTLVACQKEQITKNEISKMESSVTEGTLPTAKGITPIAYCPDLVITSITTSMLGNLNSPCGSPMITSVCGQLVTAQVVVKNIGTAPVTNLYQIRYGKISGTPALYNFTSPSATLAPGATHVFNIPATSYSSCSGTFNIEQLAAFVDINNDVAECNETNNRSKIIKYCSE